MSGRVITLVSAFALVAGWSAAAVGEIHDAAARGDVAVVKMLLEQKPELVNSKDEAGLAPLHLACRGAQLDVVRMLLGKGADVNATFSISITPLHQAAQQGLADLVQLLLDHGANPAARMSNGVSVLHQAASSRQPKVVELLLARKLDLNVRDYVGNTPLMTAVLYGSEETVRLLIEGSADVNLGNNRFANPLDVARRDGHFEIASLLARRGAKSSSTKPPIPKGRYLGQDQPGPAPRLFAPGIVSTELEKVNSVFSTDGKEFYFTNNFPTRGHTIMEIKRYGNQWVGPRIVSFSGRNDDVGVFVTNDGSRLYYCSKRPSDGKGTAREESDLFVVETKEGGWGEPVSLGSNVNSNRDDTYPTLNQNGVLYFSSNRDGGLGAMDIYRCWPQRGGFLKAENLSKPINTQAREFDPFIAPDDSYLIFASDRPGGLGKDDLYIAFRRSDSSWTEPINLGDTVNSSASEFAPMLTPDQKFFFFTSNRAGVADIYWVGAEFIPLLQARASR